MKNMFKFMGIAAVLAVIGFSVASCGGGDPAQTVATFTDIPLQYTSAMLTLTDIKSGKLVAYADAGVSNGSARFNLKNPDDSLFNGEGKFNVGLQVFDNMSGRDGINGTAEITYGCSISVKDL